MSNNKSIFSNKTFLVALSFLLIMLLGAIIFGMEYSSAVSDAEKNNSVIKALESKNAEYASKNTELKSKNNELESKNAENESKISNHQKERDDLNSKIKELENEVSNIKLTKSKLESSKKALTTAQKENNKNSNKDSNKKPDEVKIDLSNLTAPNEGYKVCYLTFDDGPSDNTLKILDILKKANAKASFFVISTSNLDYVKRIHNEGHTVALHANNHVYSNIYKSEENYFKDLNAISNKIKNLIGIEPKIIRFPGGSSNTVSKTHNKGIMTRLTKQVQQKGYVYFDWNVDSNDATGNVPKATILNSIKNGAKGKGDICVLMHDSAAKKTTVDALPEMICYLRSQGYRFEALTPTSPIFHHSVNN